MFLQIMGLILVVIIGCALLIFIFFEARFLFYKWIDKIQTKGINNFLDKHEGNSYWICNGNRKPFGEFHSYLFSQFRKGGLSGNSIRDKVDEIITNYAVKSSEDN